MMTVPIFHQRPVVEDQPVFASADVDIRRVEQVAVFILALHQFEADALCDGVTIGRGLLGQGIDSIESQTANFLGLITADPLANHVAVLVRDRQRRTGQLIVAGQLAFGHIEGCSIVLEGVFQLDHGRITVLVDKLKRLLRRVEEVASGGRSSTMRYLPLLAVVFSGIRTPSMP